MKIIVPEGMLRSFDEAIQLGLGSTPALEVALRWLSENLPGKTDNITPWQAGYNRALADVQRMFLAPEPDVPEAVKDLLQSRADVTNQRILEAYRRGQKAGFP